MKVELKGPRQDAINHVVMYRVGDADPILQVYIDTNSKNLPWSIGASGSGENFASLDLLMGETDETYLCQITLLAETAWERLLMDEGFPLLQQTEYGCYVVFVPRPGDEEQILLYAKKDE